MNRKESMTLYLTPDQHDALKVLTEASKVSMSEHIRQGVDLILRTHGIRMLDGVKQPPEE